MAPSISNDNLWPNMNTTGVQTFLGDLYTMKLATGTHGPLDITASNALVHKDFSVVPTFISTRPAAARAVLLSRLPLAQVIQVMRTVPFSENILTVSMPCWADLNRTYEMAHTERHQALCNQQRPMNAAFYLEVLFRNLKPNDLATSTYLPAIQISVFNYIKTTPGGTQWVQAMVTPNWLAIADEVALWHSHGLVFFQNSFQNYYLEGTQESIWITNALGIQQSITISSFTATNRPKTQWSSATVYSGLWNDIDACVWLNTSAIRASPDNFESKYGAGWESWDYYYIGTAGTEATHIIRTSLGPLTVIDVFLVSPPPSLLKIVDLFRNALNSALLTNPQDYVALNEPTIDITPATWLQHGNLFYGGSPLCPFGFPKPYVQISFGYYNDCGAQPQHTIPLTRDSVLFAIVTAAIQPSKVATICNMSSLASTCMAMLTPAVAFRNLLNETAFTTEIRQATQDTIALNTAFVQWATVSGTNQVLYQPMVSRDGDPWSFVGWMTMYEWVMGQREVYTFEGDWNIWTLMSSRYELVPFAANEIELTHNASTNLWVVSCYISCVIGVVVVLVLVYSIIYRFNIDGRNLFFCNRLVGGTWIGRPFLFARGTTTIVILATSPIVFNSYEGFAKLDFTPRPTWHTCLLAGEITWITYVVNDILLPVTKPYSHIYAPVSSFLAWLAVVIIEITYPYTAQATIDRICNIMSFTRGLMCTNGGIQIGNYDRVVLLFTVAITSAPLGYVIAQVIRSKKIDPHTPKLEPVSFHLAGSSEAFLLSPPNKLDVAACVLSGLIPIGRHLFDLKTWNLIATVLINDNTFALRGLTSDIQAPALMNVRQTKSYRSRRSRSPSTIRSIGLVGFVYMCGALVSSFTYLFESITYFSNDFLWPGFNDTNTHAFLVNWFNVQLQLSNSTPPLQIDTPSYGDYATTNKITQYNVLSSAIYPIMIQDEVNSLPNVIQGLRTMNSCMFPWIATSYCFVDFGKTWQMAFSAERQKRCKEKEMDNGAVYLEAMLRNVNWPSLSICWDGGLETAIFADIRNTNSGVSWVASLQSNNPISVSAEIQIWLHNGITRYTTMWQNYKLLGVTESFIISNYAGHGYSLKLKKSNSSFHLSAATAFKMYSPFAYYLTNTITNNSMVAGKSLIRGTPSFAFSNISTQAEFQSSGVLKSPLDAVFEIFYNTIGPFGDVDMKRVQAPEVLRQLYHTMRKFLLKKLSSSNAIQDAFWSIYTQHFFFPQPSAWDPPALMWGGDMNCGLNFGGNTTFPLQYFSSSGLCGDIFWDYMKPLTQNLWMAILASGSQTPPNATAVSCRDSSHKVLVFSIITESLAIMTEFMSPDELSQFDNVSSRTKSWIRDVIQLEIIQYLSFDGVAFHLSRVNVFDPTELNFEFFSWLYLFEWAEGKREVISLHGSLDTITTISTTKPLVQELTNTIEIPLNLGRLFYTINFYITSVLFSVGCLVALYIVNSRGYVDGINIVAFNYVAGHVWIGRPLMLLRSLTSIAVLSTSQLSLIAPRAGLTSYFQSPPRDILTTLVSSGEMAWLVYVVIDTFSVFTGEYTAYYSTPSVAVVTISVAIWSFATPTMHSVQLSRQCTVLAVDFDVACVSGVVNIGDFTRLRTLIGIAGGGCLLTYILVRTFLKKPPRLPPLSPLLYSAAKSEFELTTHVNWEFEGAFYLDKASATMTGIITFKLPGTLYVVDIKTWRVFALPSNDIGGHISGRMPPHIQFAMPLTTTDCYT
ncbi:Aste57867_19942 [Aphanomyces stellatus]|uniref:Aste57867_19942 protein n=1 Tax=Aphanomyces stellatus TaxID=120398 RepID=A0A485LFQ5_9STRA|nr:hypothetical protein As57867_019876 [Aphanomyces stellatus]VFT96639.1 Aste57867_19942 [Aphanomyces stellatus]